MSTVQSKVSLSICKTATSNEPFVIMIPLRVSHGGAMSIGDDPSRRRGLTSRRWPGISVLTAGASCALQPAISTQPPREKPTATSPISPTDAEGKAGG